MMESGSTVSSSFGPSPNLHLISHSRSYDAPVKTKLGIVLSLLIGSGHNDEEKLLVHTCVTNFYINAFNSAKVIENASI